ncbi:MAG: SPW repeat protein [Persicimonas sp.]
MERWSIHWQDVVAMVAGAWLIATVMAQISTASSVFSGWFFFICGAALILLGAGALADDHPGISWAMAVFAAVVLVAPFITGITGDAVATWSAVIPGVIALAMSVWSALSKRGEREEIPGRRDGERVTLRDLGGDLRRAVP